MHAEASSATQKSRRKEIDGLKVMCAVLDVRDCTQDMDGKELPADSWAISTLRQLTKELSDALRPSRREIIDTSLGFGVRGDIWLLHE